MTAQAQLATARHAAPESSPAPFQSAGRLLHGYSIEVTGADRTVAEACDSDLPIGTEVFIAFTPGERPERVVQAARRLSAAGLTPTPHIIARAMTSQAMLERLLGRLADEGGARQALVLAGDRAEPAGPYHCSLELVETGLFERRGFRRLAFALHPEGHPAVGAAEMRQALQAKLAAARFRGLEARLVSQFTVDAAPILPRLLALHGEAPGATARIGLAGPTDPGMLLKYALYCGVGASLKGLRNHGEALAQLNRNGRADQILADLALALDADTLPLPRIEGIHLFTFGGVAKSVAWANRLIAEAGCA
ncbi:hypothetical protein [Phenylobacterium montanum]|uniref:Methylenetetrahydrofolate reductase n=1 Tax=Phenylobacterium montanum TaxID=2823693 RepID=A0A975G2L9_9CAUL|nr:hypothetical protein [Caulobacter sp. S6]QUD89644.1 hypothetical protein KCG34_07155 [Caulobacter sp. S6]